MGADKAGWPGGQIPETLASACIIDDLPQVIPESAPCVGLL